MSLREILERIREELLERDKHRQEIQLATRRVTRLSKQAIFQTHGGDLEKAEETLREAKGILWEIKRLAENYPALFYTSSVDLAFQEYAEAMIFLNLVRGSSIPSFEDINVPMIPYVLGLADVIGELRRRSLEFLRRDRIDEAEECLDLMETIFEGIIDLEEIQILIPGLRRKCDTARRVIEATRADIMIESGRVSLERCISKLMKKMSGDEEHGSSKARRDSGEG